MWTHAVLMLNRPLTHGQSHDPNMRSLALASVLDSFYVRRYFGWNLNDTITLRESDALILLRINHFVTHLFPNGRKKKQIPV